MLIVIKNYPLTTAEITILNTSATTEHPLAVIMLADGVYNQQRLGEQFPELNLHALQSDMTLRGVQSTPNVTPITMEQLMALSVTHYPWITL